MEQKVLNFPKNFFWGTATSAHQVEGNNINSDWWHWENSSSRLKSLERKGKNSQDFISGKSCDHYHRFEDDFILAKNLNNNAHRFSLEWSRIEPGEGKFSKEGIDHYRQVIDALKKNKLEPFVTLWHFTLPQWFLKIGGWENKDSVKYFTRYVEKVVREYPQVKFWITFNEPLVYLIQGYVLSVWPPKRRLTFFRAIRVFRNLILAHKRAYKIIHKINKNAKVSIAQSAVYCYPKPLNRRNFYFIRLVHWLWNRFFIDQIIHQIDFIGLNYYFRRRISLRFFHPFESFYYQQPLEAPQRISDIGWEIYPKGTYYILKDFSRYKKPIYILENGIADQEDKKRGSYIKGHLRWIWQAIQEGVDVRGYFYWSLIDNFEWDQGFSPRFGLYEVDYQTLERKMRPSAEVYKKICQENGVKYS